jgi:hypothetical protein
LLLGLQPAISERANGWRPRYWIDAFEFSLHSALSTTTTPQKQWLASFPFPLPLLQILNDCPSPPEALLSGKCHWSLQLTQTLFNPFDSGLPKGLFQFFSHCAAGV